MLKCFQREMGGSAPNLCERCDHFTTEPSRTMLDWNCIDTVFLDMDGTLLALRFDKPFAVARTCGS